MHIDDVTDMAPPLASGLGGQSASSKVVQGLGAHSENVRSRDSDKGSPRMRTHPVLGVSWV
jgi:hypothetical protein